MSQPTFDITPFLHQDEGQHFDRESLFEGPEGAKRARNRRTVRDQVAEYVAGFANAEGGVLAPGIEDDHTVAGHTLPADALAALLTMRRARLLPPQPEGFVVEAHGKALIVFDVPAADVPVQVVGVGITLRNTPTLTAADREFVARLGSTEVSDEEFRALLHAHRHGRVENADLRSLAGLDTLNASLLLRKLRDRSLLELHPHGANSYYTLPSILSEATDRGERDANRGERDANRGERDAGRGEPTPEILAAIGQLGARPRKERLRAVIETICSQRDWTTPAELARWLNILPANLTDRHLSPMVQAGLLERRYPATPTHAEQAYRSTRMQMPLGLSGEERP